MNLSDLGKKISYSWKIQSKSKDRKKASVVAYIDARDVMKLLDEVVGPENWKDAYTTLDPACKSVQCSLSVKVGDEWVAKEDIGTASEYEAEKGAFSDAFKRAAVKWGVGRFLYDLEIEWVDLDQYGSPIDESGKPVKDLTTYVNQKIGKPQGSATSSQKAKPPGADALIQKQTMIKAKLKILGQEPATVGEANAVLKKLTSLAYEPANYDDILERLNVHIKELADSPAKTH